MRNVEIYSDNIFRSAKFTCQMLPSRLDVVKVKDDPTSLIRIIKLKETDSKEGEESGRKVTGQNWESSLLIEATL